MNAKTGGFAKNLKKFALVGAAAGAVALAGLGAASVKMALDFESSFAEVKTLLPTLGEAAFGKLQDDLLAFSKEMGIATDQAVPALYQAISAGVPPNNVMTFMETAAKASIGGVTDLETAVDGITSVVNAYGAEVLSAQQASDLMFTAVKLGKTDFNQLSTSLFNVIPTAASLNVGFSDIAASLATITAAGTPTSVATTQLRQALVEASKGGTKLDKALRALTGKSFPELIDSGETMPGIFQKLRKSMPEQEFKDLFGSVEAVNGVLGITGPNFEKVQSAMDEMAGSAGATNKAFETIAVTNKFKLNKAINSIKVTMLDLGLKVMPLVAKALVGVSKGIDFLIKGIDLGAEAFSKFIKGFKEAFTRDIRVGATTGIFGFGVRLGAMARKIASEVIPVVKELARVFIDDLLPVLKAIGRFIVNEVIPQWLAFEKARIEVTIGIVKFLLPALDTLADLWKNVLQPALKAVVKVFVDEVVPILARVGQFLLDHKQLVMGVATVLLLLSNPWLAVIAIIVLVLAKWDEISLMFTKTIPAAIDSVITKIRELPIIGEIFEGAFNAARIIVVTAFELIRNAVETAVGAIINIVQLISALIRGDWSQAWTEFKELVSGIWDGIRDHIEIVIGAIIALVRNQIGTILGVLLDAAPLLLEAGKALLKAVLAGIKLFFELQMKLWFEVLPKALIALVKLGFQALLDLGKWLLGTILDGIKALWDDELKPFFTGLPGNMVDLVKQGSQLLLDVGRWALEQVLDGVKALWNDALKPFFMALPSNIVDLVKQGSQLLLDVGGWVLQQVHDGIKALWDDELKPFFMALPSDIVDLVKQGSELLLGGGKWILQTVWDGIKDLWISVSSWFKERPQAMVDNLKLGSQLLLDVGKWLLMQIRDGAVAGWLQAKGWFAEIPSKIVSALGVVDDILLEAGKAILRGLKAGAEAVKDEVLGFFGGIGKSVKDAVTFGAGIFGDPTVPWAIAGGKAITEGLAQGMGEGFSAVEQQAKSIEQRVGQILSTITSGASALKSSLSDLLSGTADALDALVLLKAGYDDLAQAILDAVAAGAGGIPSPGTSPTPTEPTPTKTKEPLPGLGGSRIPPGTGAGSDWINLANQLLALTGLTDTTGAARLAQKMIAAGWNMDTLSGLTVQQIAAAIGDPSSIGLQRGMFDVPFTGLLASLHKGEMVLPARVADMFRREIMPTFLRSGTVGGGDTITVELNQEFFGPADPEAVREASTEGLYDALRARGTVVRR